MPVIKLFKKEPKKVITDFDIFYKFNPEVLTITITGTNGKSTTSKLLYDILKNHHYDTRLTGNIGNPILEEKKLPKILSLLLRLLLISWLIVNISNQNFL